MPFDRFLIAPINTGLETDLKPWLVPDDAFTSLQNAYVFRGRVRKRFGSIWMGTTQLATRLRVQVGTIGSPSSPVPGSVFQAGQMISASTQIFTIISNTSGAQSMLGADISTGMASAGSGTFDVSTGNFVLTGTGLGNATPIFFYPGLPVMGITQFEIGAVNNHPTYAFDPEFAYTFSGNAWIRSFTTNAGGFNIPTFHDPNVTNLYYYWTYNWTGLFDNNITMYVTNFQIGNPNGLGLATDDPIWTLTNVGGSGGTNTWSPFSYSPDADENYENQQPITVTRTNSGNSKIVTNYIQSALIIVAFKNRLLLLNTIENNANGAIAYDPTNHGTRIASGMTPATYLTSTNTQFVNRCRFSAYASPFASNSWLEPNQIYNPGSTGVVNAAGADFIDATTDEAIISAEFIKDRLIVYFERSTWELVYTFNEVNPFVWQKLNTELGSQSTFSTVPFDKEVLTIGNTGIHSCSGANVYRIDNKIPDEIFDAFEAKNSAPMRTAGIRDYYTEMVYWAFVDTEASVNQNFANQVLVYNYKNGSWALNDDCFTTFGYFEQSLDMTWASSAPLTWQAFSGDWQSNIIDANHRQILAGTPEGYVLIIDPDEARNAGAMQITNIVYAASGILTLTIYNHNLTDDPIIFPNDEDFILIENVVDSNPVNEALLNNSIWPVFSVIDANTITINTNGLIVGTAQTYLGGGTAARVSNIQIFTKRFNPYVDKDRNVYLHKIDFAVQRTAAGQITVDYFPSSSELSMIAAGVASGSIMGNSILETSPYDPAIYPFESQQELLWHPIYFQTSGTTIQIALYFSAQQMVNPNVSLSDFELEGFCLYTQPTSVRQQ